MSKLLIGAEAGTDQDTYVLRVSDQGPDFTLSRVADLVAKTLEGYSNGADLTEGIGVWGGDLERSVTITIQGERHHAEIILDALARKFPRLRYVHVEVHRPDTQYVDLAAYRAVNAALDAIADVG